MTSRAPQFETELPTLVNAKQYRRIVKRREVSWGKRPRVGEVKGEAKQSRAERMQGLDRLRPLLTPLWCPRTLHVTSTPLSHLPLARCRHGQSSSRCEWLGRALGAERGTCTRVGTSTP